MAYVIKAAYGIIRMNDKGKQPVNVSQMFKEVLDALKESADIPPIKEPADVDALAKQMEATMRDLNEKAEQLYKATGMTKEQLQAFAENRQNFTEEEWRLLTEVRNQVRQFQNRAEQIVEQGLQAKLEEQPETAPKPAGKKKGSGKRRIKRKDWMQG
jgi:cytochrome c556